MLLYINSMKWDCWSQYGTRQEMYNEGCCLPNIYIPYWMPDLHMLKAGYNGSWSRFARSIPVWHLPPYSSTGDDIFGLGAAGSHSNMSVLILQNNNILIQGLSIQLTINYNIFHWLYWTIQLYTEPTAWVLLTLPLENVVIWMLKLQLTLPHLFCSCFMYLTQQFCTLCKTSGTTFFSLSWNKGLCYVPLSKKLLIKMMNFHYTS
jgi:hypothetical protein